MEVGNQRPKKFMSMDSLWYEEERLATFIDWPLKFISQEELAAEGFYYLRTKDHCACAFCRGIIGSWEEGDTPSGEHRRHFPNCPFVQGKVTPNVPLNQGKILAKVPRVIVDVINPQSGDVCGTGKVIEKPCSEERILTKSSTSSDVSMSSFGFRQYCGPKRKDFITNEARLRSYKLWPEKVKQTSHALAEAGFFYCGLSDHVRCFHCGNGLRNWEPEDIPWEEHARWYPDCHFVLLKKGIDFVDKVRRERPPYIPVHSNHSASSSCASSSSQTIEKSNVLNDKEMETLMELPIIKGVLDMGFSRSVVKKALRRYILETGSPFFTLESGIEVVLEVMEEETRETIHGCKNIATQARNISSAESSDQLTCISTTGNPESLPLSDEISYVMQRSTDGEVAAVTPEENEEISNIPGPDILDENSNDSGVSTVIEEPSIEGTPAVTDQTTEIGARGFENSSYHSSDTIYHTENRQITEISVPVNDHTIISENVLTNSTPFPCLPTRVSSSSRSSNILPPLPSISRASPPLRSSTPTSHIDDTYPQPMDLEAAHQGTDSSVELEESASETSNAITTNSERTSTTHSSVAIRRSSHSDPADLPMEYYTEDLPQNTELPIGVYPLISEADVIMEEAAKLLLGPPLSSRIRSGESCDELKSSRKVATKNKSSTTENSLDEEKSSCQTSGKAEKLAQELERMKENRMCKVCMDKEMDVVFLPCTHMVTCSSCAVALASCPICRRDIQYAFKPIIS